MDITKIFKMRSDVYDALKFVALIVLPAFGTAYIGLSAIWGLPFGSEIRDTVLIIDTFLGAVLGISSHEYNKEN